MRIAVSRAPGAERVVTPLELFFDLVYVFAIGQLSHHLLEHVDLRTGAESAILTLAVVYAWYMVAWGANWLDPDRLPVRLLLVGLMFASLLMSVGIAISAMMTETLVELMEAPGADNLYWAIASLPQPLVDVM